MDLNKLKEIQAVVFDMDGLMFDSERYVQKSWDIAGERLGYGPLGHNIVNTLGTNLTNRKKYFLEHYGNDFPFDEFLQTYRKPEPDIYIEACRQLKVDPSKAIALEDAINGIRSAHGAGMNPVMIPDIVQDTSKVDDILFGKCESLLEFAEILQGVTLDIEKTQK